MGPKQCYQQNGFNERPGFIHEWSSEAGVQVLCLSPFLGFRVPHRNGERSRGFAVAAAAVYGGGARGCESLQSRHPHRSRELCQWAGVSLWFWFEFLFVLSFSLIGWYVHANWFYWCGKDLIFWCLGQRKFVTFDFKDENLNILRVKLCCYLISGWFIVLTYWSCWFEKRFDFGCLWWEKFRAFGYMQENLCLRVICYCLLVRMRL